MNISTDAQAYSNISKTDIHTEAHTGSHRKTEIHILRYVGIQSIINLDSRKKAFKLFLAHIKISLWTTRIKLLQSIICRYVAIIDTLMFDK